jgi:membrane protein
VLDALVELDWVGRLDEEKDARYVLLVDPAATRAEPLVARLLLDPAPDLAPTWKRAGFDSVRLAELLPRPTATA